MKINFEQPLLNEYGEQYIDIDFSKNIENQKLIAERKEPHKKPWLMKDAVIQMLLAQNQQIEQLEKLQRGKIVLSLIDGKDEFSAEELVIIKKATEQHPNPIVYYRIINYIEQLERR